MCGHVGMAGDTFNRDLDVLRDLIWVDSIRGYHNTGLATVSEKGETDLLKVEGPALWLLIDDKFKKMLSLNNRVFIGHNRHATVGNHSKTNAHPFEFERVIGAHNGTLDGRSRREIPNFDQYGTDSAALYAAIDEYGVENVVPEIEGAWALVWYDKEEETINFLRNSLRPFHYCFSEDGRMIYWASEDWMLRGILGRHNVKIDAKHGIIKLKENKWVSFKVPKNRDKFGYPTITEVAGYKTPHFFRKDHNHPMAEILDGWTPDTGTHHVNQPKASENASKPKSSNEKPLKGQDVKPGSPPQLVVLPGGKTKTDPFLGDLKDAIPTTSVLDQCFILGGKAYERGSSLTANPFAAGTHQHFTWTSGWYNAERERPVGSGPTMKGFRGELITEDLFKAQTGGTCSWCDDVIEFGTPVTFFARDRFFCSRCEKNEKFKEDFGEYLSKGA